MIRAVIFDCFGVLVGKGFEYTYQLAGGDPVKDKDFILDTLGQANLGLMSDAAFHAAMADKNNMTLAAWHDVIYAADQPDQQLLNYIKTLRDKGYKTAILSNANHGSLTRNIGDEQLERCFDELIVSAEVGMMKPESDIYRFAAQKLDVELTECIFIDDRASFLSPAADLGMKTILYQDFEHTVAEINRLTDTEN